MSAGFSKPSRMDVLHILKENGPAYFPYVVFGCAVVENDITFIMAGIYIASLHMPSATANEFLAQAALCGIAGALVHDSIWFWLGRKNASRLRGTTAWKKVGPQIESWAARFGQKEMFLCRFVPGTRNVSSFFWGVHRMKVWIFYGIEVCSLSIWGTLLVILGYKFWKQTEAFLGKVRDKHLGRWLLLALVLTAIAYFTIRAFTRHEIVKHGKPPDDPRAD